MGNRHPYTDRSAGMDAFIHADAKGVSNTLSPLEQVSNQSARTMRSSRVCP